MKACLMHLSIFIFTLGSLAGQEAQKPVRQPAVAGSFYPAGREDLEEQMRIFFANVEDKSYDPHAAAIIVPHAGYVYSGQVAASAYAKLDPSHTYKRIFILGTSHHLTLNGASVYKRGDYLTPLGRVEVDTELAERLMEESRLFQFVEEAHSREHSIEVQLPFLQYHLKQDFKIVPIIIGTQATENCRKIADVLRPFFNSENLFVISSDFSHYPEYTDAVKTDQATGLAIASNSPSGFIQTILSNGNKDIPQLLTSCCGWSSVLTLLNLTSAERDITVRHLQYMNSGDMSFGDKNRVVGYHAFLFSRMPAAESQTEFRLSDEEKIILLKLARSSIQSRFEGRVPSGLAEKDLTGNLEMNCGAFVTLHKDGLLRGCIGRFTGNQPLYRVVEEMARAAAFSDTRFNPLSRDELPETEIEISVLSPLKRIYSPDEFELGKHGIYMIHDNRTGTFLPQVAGSTGWNKEEFLGHCARDKAGIGWDGWKKAELYVYEALVFDESQLITGEK